jgi:hypothetical protein
VVLRYRPSETNTAATPIYGTKTRRAAGCTTPDRSGDDTGLRCVVDVHCLRSSVTVSPLMGSLIKKRRKRMRKKKHKKLLKRTRWQRRQQGR